MKKEILEIVKSVDEIYDNPKCELNFSSNYELLVAVILSAQCTDKRVNIVTAELFKEYSTAFKMIELSQAELEEKIRPCGFFHNKAKHILSCSKELVEKYNGEVPSDKEKLKALAGVGEKTANVVLRVSNRLGLASAKTVEKTQKALEKNIPKDKWIKFHYSLVLHGRYVCKSQRPNCAECKLSGCCKFYKTKNKNK